MSIFSPVILNGYKFTDYDVLKKVITLLKTLQMYQELVSIEINHFK